MHQWAPHEDESEEALHRFQMRMIQMHEELRAINRELGRQDLIALARRTRELIYRTRGLLDGNVAILFADQPDRMVEDLYRQLDYAQGHVTRAVAEEYEFEVIKQRLYMATALAEDVIKNVAKAVADMLGIRPEGDG